MTNNQRLLLKTLKYQVAVLVWENQQNKLTEVKK